MSVSHILWLSLCTDNKQQGKVYIDKGSILEMRDVFTSRCPKLSAE